MSKHPYQPIDTDSQGTPRFKENAIVRYLLDNGPFDMNKIAELPFSREDRVQFAQLIGYSLNGFSELNYVNDVDYAAAQIVSPEKDSNAARLEVVEEKLREVREKLRDGLAILYERHPDDFDVFPEAQPR